MPFSTQSTFADDLDKLATTLSAFSISPVAAVAAAQELRELQSDVSRLEKERDAALANNSRPRSVIEDARRDFSSWPSDAPRRRVINGIEIEKLDGTLNYRVRFGESVVAYTARDWDSVTLYKDILRSFATQLASSLGVLYTYGVTTDEEYREDTIAISRLHGERSASTALAIAAMRFSSTVTRPADDSPPDPQGLADEDGLPGEYDSQGEWMCTCQSCAEARERFVGTMPPEFSQGATMSIPADLARRITLADMPVYREPESERAISASDENHWGSIGPNDL